MSKVILFFSGKNKLNKMKYLGYVWMREWIWKSGFEWIWDENVWKVWLFGSTERW